MRGCAFLLAFLVGAGFGQLQTGFDEKAKTYFVSIDDQQIMTGAPVSLYTRSEWFNSTAKDDSPANLLFKTTKPLKDSDELGAYTGTEVHWELSETPTSGSFITRFKNYEAGNLAALEFNFPDGATGTARTNSGGVITVFPAFDTEAMKLPGLLAWQGTFIQPRNRYTDGPTGGPLVFYREGFSDVVVLSPFNHFKTTSSQNFEDQHGMKVFAMSTAATVEQLPVDFTHRFVLYRGRGLTQTMYEWGQLMQESHNTVKKPDLTTLALGYQTDNGAMYCFCRKDCDTKLLDMKSYLDDISVPIQYLSHQGGWWKARETAPWCVTDFETNGAYPMGLTNFTRKLDLPWQMYVPYFCNNTEFTQKWPMMESDPSIPGCDDYSFYNVDPDDSETFYGWLFDWMRGGQGPNLQSFEVDFLTQNYICSPRFISNITAAPTFLKGMSNAAEERNMGLQYCMSTPTDVLESLHLAPVTNFRVSTDYFYGDSWDIGLSSLLVWSLGGRPSKDTFWTTDQDGASSLPHHTPPPDHSDVGCELHTMLALMTTGPVGFSDAINMTNASLIMRTVNTNGVLLQPSKAITSIDRVADVHANVPGQVMSTFSGSHDSPWSWYFASFKLREDFDVRPSDFWPPLPAGTKFAYREWHQGGCEDDTKPDDCVNYFTPSEDDATVFTLPANKEDDPWRPALITVWPVCASGWVVLGELDKFVSTSSVRFKSIECTEEGATYKYADPSSSKDAVVTVLKPKRIAVFESGVS